MNYEKFYSSRFLYYEGFEAFCDLNAIRLLLENKGVKNALLYIDASMNCEFDFSKEVKNYYEKLFELTKKRGVLSPNNKNIKKNFYDLNKPTNLIMKEGIELLEKGGPYAVGVDSYYLSYMKEYKKIHSWHTIIFCGVDEKNQFVYVVDWAEPWFYKGMVPMSEFVEARNSTNELNNDIYSGLPILNYTLQVLKEWEIIDEKKLIEMVIRLSLENYYWGPDFKKKEGIRNILNISNYINNIYLDKEINNYEELLNDMYKQIYINLKRYKLFREYLNYSKALLMLKEELEKIIKSISYSISEWELFSISILKLKTQKTDKNMNKMLTKANELYCLEVKIGEQLKDILNRGIR